MEVHSRTKTAIEIIEQGQPFQVDNLLLSKPDKSSLAVTGWTQCVHLDSLTEDFALKELAAIKRDFKDLVLSSIEWKAFIKEKVIEYNLAFDDYGKAGISICNEKDGKITWLSHIKK
jgi:hypothetical protein